MFNLILKSYRKLVTDLTKSQFDELHKAPDKSNAIEDALENSCGKVTIHLRKDGEFAVASDFTDYGSDMAETTGVMFHMINSGNLAEYFAKSLKLWAEDDIEKETFAKEILQRWKKLFYEENGNELLHRKKNGDLAVDPSDVFGLKDIKS